MAAKTYMKAAEGFDIYPDGLFSSTNYPWNVSAPASSGAVTPNAGAFAGAKALAFTGGTTVAASGLQYTFETSLKSGYNTALTSDRGVIGFGFWFNMNQMTAAATHWLLALGSSTAAGVYNVFGITAALAGAASMQFLPPAGGSVNYPITTNVWYWVDIRFAIDSQAMTWRYEYRVNDTTISSGTIPWTAVSIAAGNKLDRLYMYVASQLQWKMDDLVVRSASAADADWGGSTPVVVADLLPMNSRRIYKADPVSNGSVVQWESSDVGTANYLAATDPTGTLFVNATDVDQTDLYKFAPPAGVTPTDISGVVYRGSSPQLGAVVPQVKDASNVQKNMSPQSSGASRFIGVADTNNGAAWTSAGIVAAEFGQKSI